MGGQVGVWSEEHNPTRAGMWCIRAPSQEAFTPLRPALVPSDQHQGEIRIGGQLSGVVEAQHLDAGAGTCVGDPGCDQQVARDDGDRHSASAGSTLKGWWTGCGCTPFDPLNEAPSMT